MTCRKRSIISWLLGERCAACGRQGSVLCGPCGDLVRPATPPPGVDGVDRCLVLMEYTGVARGLVLSLKYRNHRSVVDRLGGALALLAAGDPDSAALLDHGGATSLLAGEPRAPLVTWVPTSRHRRLQRGFDQSELLARSVAAHLGLQCRRLLARCPGPAQTGLPLAARRSGPRFDCHGPPHAGIVLVDDVMTSGATMQSAAVAVKASGASWVLGLAVAQTPLKVRVGGAEN